MTQGEKAVWAATFVLNLKKLHNPPREVLLPGNRDKYNEWEREVTHDAMEAGGHAVMLLRQHAQSFRDAGEEDALASLLDDMLTD